MLEMIMPATPSMLRERNEGGFAGASRALAATFTPDPGGGRA